MRRSFLDLGDAVVVVTGASSGIGRATANRLAGRGARLVLAARGTDALDLTVEECIRAGGEAVAVPTDVSDRKAVAALADAAVRRFGRIDAWINNAGVMAYGRFDAVPVESHVQVVETNLLGTVHGAAEAVPRFRRQGRGVLVNVASLYAEMTTPLVSSYVTSKYGILGLSRVLRRDLRPDHDIAVCCVLPASVDTPIFRNAANYHGRVVRAIPPVASPDRVARAIVRCLVRPRNEVRIGWIGRFVAFGEKAASPVYDRVINRAFRLIGFRRAGRSPHDGNLFDPGRAWKQVDGEWRNAGARWGLAGAVALVAGAAVGRGVRARR